MSQMKRLASSGLRATVIGDVVGSRQVADRSAQHHLLNAALRDIAEGAIDPPAFTVGDLGGWSVVELERLLDDRLDASEAM